MNDPTYPSLDQWKHAGIVSVQLDAIGDAPAYVADLELPDLQAFIASGSIPPVLVDVAMRVELNGIDEEKEMAKPEAFAKYLDLQAFVIASNLRKPNLIEELGSLDAAVAWVRDSMPGLHRYQLWRTCMHLDLNLRGLQSALRSLEDLSAFRERDGRPDVPESGDSEREVAV